MQDPKTSEPVRIRRAVASDLDALVELENRVFDYDRMSARQLRRHVESVSASLRVAVLRRVIVGSAVVFYRRRSRVARLYSIAIAEQARGRGVGERLLVSAEQAARSRGCIAMRLEVRTDNPAAQRLYERNGYRLRGRVKSFYEDGQDALRYEKTLEP